MGEGGGAGPRFCFYYVSFIQKKSKSLKLGTLETRKELPKCVLLLFLELCTGNARVSYWPFFPCP